MWSVEGQRLGKQTCRERLESDPRTGTDESDGSDAILDLAPNRRGAIKEFDRPKMTGQVVKGLGTSHHIHLRTTPQWRSQRRLVQELMTPRFLNKVTGPAIHRDGCELITLWRAKSRITNGRPWAAEEDILSASLDGVLSFTFGARFGQKHGATRSALEALDTMTAMPLQDSDSEDNPVEFPKGQASEVLRATLELVSTPWRVFGSFFPELKWAYISMSPQFKRAKKIKDGYITNALRDAVTRIECADQDWVKCAADHMVSQERILAEKDERKPDYTSRIMIDEVSSGRWHCFTLPPSFCAITKPKASVHRLTIVE